MNTSDSGQPKPRSARAIWLAENWLWLAGIFLVGLGAKFWLILKYGSPLPYWDPWDAEASKMFLPYFAGHLTFADLIRPHNEHRIIIPRIYCLVLMLLNRQWDVQLQMVVNALIHSATLTGLAALLARWLGKKYWLAICPPVVAALALPFAWENTLGGGTLFYFLLIFSLLTIIGLGLGEPWSWRWWVGVGASVAALLTGASGFLAAVPVVGLLALDLVRDSASWRRCLPTLVVCGVVIIAGWLLKPDVPGNHHLQAHSAREFLLSLGKNLAWPQLEDWRYAPLNVFPLLTLGWLCIRAGRHQRPAERMILALGIWVMLQALAAAYARGTGGGVPAWRYMDILSLLMIANCAGILLVVTGYRLHLPARVVLYAGFAYWIYSSVGGLRADTHLVRKHVLPDWAVRQEICLHNTQHFMTTDDPHALENDDPFKRPYPNTRKLVILLRRPDIRKILPACVREPIEMQPCDQTDRGFVTNGCASNDGDPPWERSWSSCPRGGEIKTPSRFEGVATTPSKLPYLEIPIAGDLGKPGLSLNLVETSTGKTNPVKPTSATGTRWQEVYVKAPAGEFKLIAQDDSATGWFAFKEPREVGRLSYWTVRVMGAWKYFLIAGMAGLLVKTMLSSWQFFTGTETRFLHDSFDD